MKVSAEAESLVKGWMEALCVRHSWSCKLWPHNHFNGHLLSSTFFNAPTQTASADLTQALSSYLTHSQRNQSPRPRQLCFNNTTKTLLSSAGSRWVTQHLLSCFFSLLPLPLLWSIFSRLTSLCASWAISYFLASFYVFFLSLKWQVSTWPPYMS